MTKQALTDINPVVEYMVEHIVNTVAFFKNIFTYKIGAINFSELVLQKLQNELENTVELIDVNNHFVQDEINSNSYDLILALYSGNVYNFLQFLSKTQLFGTPGSGLLICGLLQNSCDSLKEIGIVDLHILDYQRLIDDILNVGYAEPVIALDSLILEYKNFELLNSDLKCFFAHTGLIKLLDDNKILIEDRFNQYIKIHNVFVLDLNLYFACAFKKSQTTTNISKTTQPQLREMFFRGKEQ